MAAVVAWTVLSVNPVAFISSVSYGTVGTLLAIRRPRNVIGWLLIAFAIQLAKPDLVSAGDIAAVAAGTASPATGLLRNEVDIAAVMRDLHATVQDAVHPASLGLWIREAKP
jgi:hypothetical protein